MSTSAIVGKIFRHYKGNHYRVIAVSEHTETRETLVTYIALYNDPVFGWGKAWTRPIVMWNDSVDGVKRFTEVCAPTRS